MKKVIALALSLIMVLALGVTSFAAGITFVVDGDTADTELPFEYFSAEWDVNNEAAIFVPYDVGDAGTLIDGYDVADILFDTDEPLSSIKVESEKGIVDVTVYNLDDYVKSNDGTTVKTKSSWPFEDFDIQDLLDEISYVNLGADTDLNLFFLYFDIPTYAGAKVSTDNYFTLKFRENTTGADYVTESEKVWICVSPWAVEDDDVETYADEDEAMELVDGYFMLDDVYEDIMADEYEDVTQEWYVFEQVESDETPYVINKDAWKEIVGSTLIVGVADDLEVEIGKIVKGQSAINFLFDTDVDDDVQAINEDAELAALNFLDTTNVLDSDFVITYTFGIEDAAKAGDYFLYELVGDELTLVEKVAVGKGDDEVDVEIERKAGETLGQYYLSDVELAAAAAEGEPEENPNTGASEVAGVAVALAVISLVSAAAVSLKK
ncbi:MAG TPA: hypothetical protein PLU75_07780 [Oscillospiraceae bacterium]|nr:hypothetical protein [Oscillospiraceae bacterium]HRW56141.1 hypothetical protein [Oscillospiraceae bacterium]